MAIRYAFLDFENFSPDVVVQNVELAHVQFDQKANDLIMVFRVLPAVGVRDGEVATNSRGLTD